MSKLVPQDSPVLHQIAEEVPVEDITSPKVQKVIKDMRETLRSYSAKGFVGVAIAAPQIGIPLRIFLVEDAEAIRVKEEPLLPFLVAINPRIVKASAKHEVVGEGCLSVPEHYGVVSRAKNATIRAYDEHGKEYERGAGGLLAQIFQHECDHLDGMLFVDVAEEVMHKSELEKRRAHVREAKGV